MTQAQTVPTGTANNLCSRPSQVPRLALDRLTACNGPLSPPGSGGRTPVEVTVDGTACATTRTLGAVLATYHAHQASKDVGSQVEAIRRTQGHVRLIVGGERAPHEYRSPRGLFAADTYAAAALESAARSTRAAELTLNSDATAMPHLWGDVASSTTMMRFEDNSIDAVIFEFVPYTAFSCWGDRTLFDMYQNHRRDLQERNTPWLWSATSPTEYRVPRRGADTFMHLARVMRHNAMLELVTGFPPEMPRRTMMQAIHDAGFSLLYLETPQSPRDIDNWLRTRVEDLKVCRLAKGSTQGMMLRAVLRKPAAGQS